MSQDPSSDAPAWQTKYDLRGRRFGQYAVLGKSDKKQYWRCRCDCGETRDVRQDALVLGATASCGHEQRGDPEYRAYLPSGAKRPEFNSYSMMMSRCYYPKATQFACYGGRGIGVCERWRQSFRNFLEDMGPRPGPSYSLDRVDTNADYAPENCRWATRKQQSRNMRVNRLLTYGGETLCLAEWAERLGMSHDSLRGRIRLGWDVGRAFNTPVKSKTPKLTKG